MTQGCRLVRITYECDGQKIGAATLRVHFSITRMSADIDAPLGETLLDVAHENDIDIEGAALRSNV